MTDFMTMKYNVDMVFCIDATGSMSPVLETVKQNALNFYDDVTKVMNEKQKSIDRLRIRVIAFRDYLADGDRAMFATNYPSTAGKGLEEYTYREIVDAICNSF